MYGKIDLIAHLIEVKIIIMNVNQMLLINIRKEKYQKTRPYKPNTEIKWYST